MYSTKNNANWISTTQSQDVGDTDWSAYQTVLTGNSKKFTVNAATTASQLVLSDGHALTIGQNLLLSTDGTNFVSSTIGNITTTAPTFPTPTKVAAQSATAPTNIAATGFNYGTPYFMKTDGMKMWTVSGTTLSEYNLTTAFDVTTATFNGKQIASFGNSAVCFSNDGTMVFTADATTFYTYYLGTAWDIGTAGSRLPSAIPGTALSTVPRCMRMSPDGQFVYVMTNAAANTGNNYINIYQLTYNNMLVTAAYYGQSDTFATITTSYSGGFEISPDGKTFIVLHSTGAATPVITVKAYSCATTPWNLSSGKYAQLGSTLTLTTTDFTGYGSNTPLGLVCNTSGTAFTVFAGTSGYVTYSTDFYTKQNINISNFGLSSAPVAAYAPAPRVFVQMDSNVSRINMMSTEQDWISSTTSQVVLGANGAGVVAANDTLTFNSGMSSTVSSVTAGTTGGLAAQYIGRADNKIAFTGKTFEIPTSAVNCMKMRSDGSAFYICDSQNIYQYNMVTPWDISTAYLVQRVYLWTFLGMSSGYYIAGVDIKPDGSKLYITQRNPGASGTVKEFTLSTPWNVGTLVPTGRSITLPTVHANGGYYGGKFNETGTQFYVQQTGFYSDCYTSYYLYYVIAYNTTTPYSFTTFDSGVTILAGGNNNPGGAGSRQPQLVPGGNSIVTISSTACEQVLNVPGNVTAGFSSTVSTATTPNAIYFAGPGGVPNNYQIDALDFSPDGMRMYVVRSNFIYQYRVRTKPLTQYTCTFPAAIASAPTAVYIPDRSVEQTVTSTLSGGTITFTSPQVVKSGRYAAVRVNSPLADSNITNVTFNLWKT